MKKLAALALAAGAVTVAVTAAMASPSDDLAAAKAASARFHSLEIHHASASKERHVIRGPIQKRHKPPR